MKKILLNIILISCFSMHSVAQNVGIGTNLPSDASKLDIESSDKGILIPRVALTATNSSSPVTGTLETSLLVYNTATAGIAPNDVSPGFYYWNGSTWERIMNASDKLDALNGLTESAADIRLGGDLIQATTINQGTNDMIFNLDGTGDFHIQDNGINHFSFSDNGNTAFGGDVEWRDENTGGTILANLFDDGNDGRFTIRENGATSVDLDANTQFIFNEQGLDRNFRIESDGNANMMFVDAGTNRVSIGTNLSAGTFNVLGNSYHSDDIYLRDGAVNGGDILVRISDSADDGIIDVYENNGINHRIHGNGVSVFNEQGNNNADMRMESDLNANMFFLDAGSNEIGIGTNNPTQMLHINGDAKINTSLIIGTPTNAGNHLLMIGAATNAGMKIGHTGGYNDVESGRFAFDENTVDQLTVGTFCGFEWHHDGATNELYLRSGCTPSDIRMTVERTGQIGFSTDNPTANLSVNGTANKTGGGTWAVFSDARLKKNITDYKEGLDFLNKVRTVNFTYNDKMDEIWGESESTKGRVYQGVIAQELKDIAPDMVNSVSVGNEINPEDADYDESLQNVNEEYYEVDPNKFTYALINAVKELNELIKNQQEQINFLLSK